MRYRDSGGFFGVDSGAVPIVSVQASNVSVPAVLRAVWSFRCISECVTCVNCISSVRCPVAVPAVLVVEGGRVHRKTHTPTPPPQDFFAGENLQHPPLQVSVGLKPFCQLLSNNPDLRGRRTTPAEGLALTILKSYGTMAV